ncbi:TetR/AcrR family transcriptional regulator [Shewanella maritima]|uniref:TetR/AcrR family transcriptional regulator n=1 Tax=Shewanella maritima TaxID=2520507 RepID=UPI003734E4B0
MTTKQYHHGDLKASLIEAANLILSRDGADSLSLRAIAAEVGVSHMAPYSHFKNKQQLIESIVESGFLKMAETMVQDSQGMDTDNPNDAPELLLTYGASYLAFATANPQLYRLMLGQVDTSGRKAIAQQPVAKTEANNRPFQLLRHAFALQSNDEQQIKAQAIGAWAMVHGLAALITEQRIQVPAGLSLKQFLAAASGIAFAPASLSSSVSASPSVSPSVSANTTKG